MKFTPIKTIIFIILLVLMVIPFNNCKGWGIPEYELNVTVEDDISGTPQAGNYLYEEFAEVEYRYEPDIKPNHIELLVNGTRWSSTGIFTLFTNLNIEVKIFDVRGLWKVTFEQPDEEDVNWFIEFYGSSRFAGTFSDDRDYHGTWIISDNSLVITYSDWEDYIFIGSVDTMAGSWTGQGLSGSWSSARALN